MNRLRFTLSALMLAVCLCAVAQKERSYIRDSYQMYNDSNFVEAQKASVKAMAVAPDSYEARYNYANSLFMQGKAKEAMAEYEALEQSLPEGDPRLAEVYHNMGNCQYVQQQYKESADNFKKALKIDPMNDLSRYNLVAAKKMMNEPPQDQNKQDQQQQQQQQQEQQQEQNQQQQQQQPQEQSMDKEQMEQMLNAIQGDENDMRKQMDKKLEVERKNIDKRW